VLAYIICSVRNGTPLEVSEFVGRLEEQGWEVHFPPRDVNQEDPSGYAICTSHRAALERSDCVYVFWDVNSKGSHFDLGMAFALRKKVVLVRSYSLDCLEKSYEKVLRIWEKES